MNLHQPHSPYHGHNQQSELKPSRLEYIVSLAIAAIFIIGAGVIILLILGLFGISPAALLNLP